MSTISQITTTDVVLHAGGYRPYPVRHYRYKKYIAHPARWAIRIALSPCFLFCSSCLSTSDHPPPDYILFSPFRRYVKHATLIEKCYPAEKISDPTPKSNELSYLIYYAQSKPAKLAKLGSYLEKRIQRDLYRRRSNDIKIDLAIFNALVNSCSKDLSFFIKNLVFSLRDVTITGDPELIWLASHTFTKFCAYHDGSTLSIDPDLCSAYRGLIKTFGSYAQSNAVSDFERLRYRLIGLRAVHALVESSATYSSDNRSEPSVLIPAILANMSPPSLSDRRSLATLESMIESLAADGDKNFVDQLLASLEGSDNICEDTVSFGDLDRWAYHILHRLAKNSHASHIRSLAHGVVRYLDLTDMWSLREWVTLLFRCIMDALPPHQQTIVIFEILSQLDWRSPWGIAADTGPPTSGLNDADIKDS
ncbi:plasma membrane localization protein, partial [Spiromyces aspiralis]